MRRSILLLSALPAVIAAAAPTGPDPLEARLIGLEKQSWVAWQHHDAAFFRRFLSDDHVEVGAGGSVGKEAVVALVGGAACTVASWSVDRFKLSRFSPDMASLTYRAEQDTSCNGRKVPSPVWATSVFVRRRGEWQNAVYVHSPAS